MRTKLHPIYHDQMILKMVKATQEIDEARKLGIDDDCEYIGYREGVYDSYHRILTLLNYSASDIDAME
ncbi:hypothetical protein [Gracilibacillus saliphilus]|uniref:hypothetical protein n=1 Tax=Gracilibacillus saliphilus TaxID=543890 RepID=UPI0013D5946F|nr:hypothetical protein [Gracilibacillus saliphilus]